MPVVADLWNLQETDTALDSRRGSLDDAQSRLGDTDELVAQRARAEELQAALRAAESAQKDVEIEADDLKAKIEPAEKKLYSGTIKNPKELGDLQADIDQLKRHLSAVEDRDLAALTAVEAADKEYRAAAGELDVMETSAREEQTELTQRIVKLQGEIAEYETERGDRLEYVDDDLLKRYEHIRAAHQGRAIAKLDRNLCLGCRISLPTQLVNKARAGNVLVQCPNCERILYA